MAKRIQRQRTKGWRMPENAVYVGRPTLWRNPFIVGGWFKMGGLGSHDRFDQMMAFMQSFGPDSRFTLIETNAMAVQWFKAYRQKHPFLDAELAELRGKDLACWCRLDQPCHADVLLEIANS